MTRARPLVDLSAYDMPPCIILRSDGATLYATRDLAAAIYRKKTYDFVKSLYVVAYQQNLHFKQFFKVLELMGNDWVKDCEHVNFGMVSMEEGTLSTRHGNVVYLEDVLDAAVEKTGKIIEEKSPDLPDKDEVAAAVGVGAVVWSMLYNSRIKDVTFSWKKVLNFDGETGPYAQYTHARCCSVLRKAGSYDVNAMDVLLLRRRRHGISRQGHSGLPGGGAGGGGKERALYRLPRHDGGLHGLQQILFLQPDNHGGCGRIRRPIGPYGRREDHHKEGPLPRGPSGAGTYVRRRYCLFAPESPKGC